MKNIWRRLACCTIVLGVAVLLGVASEPLRAEAKGSSQSLPWLANTAEGEAEWRCWDSASYGSDLNLCYAIPEGIHFSAPDDGWIVGTQGLILHWDGQRWRRVESPTTADLYGVYALGSQDAWAVGASATFLHWNGQVWTPYPNPAPGRVYALDFLAPDDGWAAAADVLLHWDGVEWKTTGNPVPGTSYLAVSMAAHDDVWAGGTGEVLAHWDGAAWTQVDLPTIPLRGKVAANVPGFFPIPPPDLPGDIKAINMVAPDNGWLTGCALEDETDFFQVPILMHWNGAQWVNMTPAGMDSCGRDVEFDPQGNLWLASRASLWEFDGSDWISETLAVGFDHSLEEIALPSSTVHFAIGEKDRIKPWLLQSQGQTWETLFSTMGDVYLRNLSFSAPGEGWATGYNESLYHWNGVTWETFSVPLSGFRISALGTLSSQDAWVVGEYYVNSSLFFRWNGTSWSQFGEGVANVYLNDIDLTSATYGWAAGRKFIWTGSEYKNVALLMNWNGAIWQEHVYGIEGELKAVQMLSETDGWAVGVQTNVDEQSYDGPLAFHWNGTDWQTILMPVTTPDALNDIALLTPDDGWAVGPEGLVLHWNGQAWSQMSSPTTDDLGEVEVVGSGEIWVRAGPGFLHMKDGIWTAVEQPTDKPVNAFEMLSPNEGWAVGDQGLILLMGSKSKPNTMFLPFLRH